MKPSSLLLLLSVLLLSTSFIQAQQLDAAFGLSGLKSTPAADASSDFSPQEVGGGVFPVFSGDFLFKKHFGVGGEVFWRAKQNLDQAFGAEQPFRPIFYDFGPVWAPKLGKRAAAELTAGIGAESARFYTPFVNCSTFSCTNYVSSNHLMGQVGGGLRLYAWNHVFVRPEAHFYFVRHNVEFSSPYSTRVGISIGYSFSGE